MRSDKFSKQFLINELKRFHDEFGRAPKEIDFRNMNNYPSSKPYSNTFGTWNKGLLEAGMKPNVIKDHKISNMKNEAILFFNENKRSPHYNELSFSRQFVNNKFGTWDNFLIECNLPLNKRQNYLKTKEDGVELLKKIHKERNKIPTTFDVDDYGINKNWFTKKFGNFNNALFEAGLVDKTRLLSREDLINRSIKELKILASELDRMPTVKEYELHLSKLPAGQCVSRRNLCNNLKMTFVEMCKTYLNLENSFGRIGHYYINKNGERCRSLPEYDISNYLFDNNIKYSDEGYYKDIIKLDKNYKYDWKLNEKTIIEYFGLYKPNETDKIIVDYINKTHKKIEICKQNNIKLIALYPKDIECDYKGVKEKLAPYINKNKELQTT